MNNGRYIDKGACILDLRRQILIKKYRHSGVKLFAEQVEIIKDRLKRGNKRSVIAKDYNVSVQTISDIATEKTWKNLLTIKSIDKAIKK